VSTITQSHDTRRERNRIKLAVPDVKTARGLLRAAGFRVSKRRVFESNMVFDTPELSLRRAATLLRVRQAGGVATLTYKGPPVIARHKSREELELEISDARAMAAIIERLGLGPVFRYEKYRTEYRQPRRSGIATLDETPVGIYLELEGTPQWIRPRRAEIGIRGGRLHHASYARLWLDWCGWHGVRASDMCSSDCGADFQSAADCQSAFRNGSLRTRIVASSTDTAAPLAIASAHSVHTLRIRSACCLEFSPSSRTE